MQTIATSHQAPRSILPRPQGAAIAMSGDGRWLAIATGEAVWLEDSTTGTQTQLALAAGHDLGIGRGRVWVARGSVVESVACAGGVIERLAVEPATYRLCVAGDEVVVSSSRGAWLVRGDTLGELGTPALVRAIGDGRFLLDGPERRIVDVTGELRGIRLAISARVLDASPVLDRSTCVLLVERAGEQELLVMRATGSVLTRVRVRGVQRIAGAARAYRVALATRDGRVIVYDLRERAVVSADRIASEPCEIVMSPDGVRLAGLARCGSQSQLFERCA